MRIEKNGTTEIPSYAFEKEQDKLSVLILSGKSIKYLGNNAFTGLKSLIYLDLSQTSIDFIPENAFEFNEESKEELTIDLRSNKYLNNSGFALNSLTRLKRPTRIILSSDNSYQVENFPYLDKNIFLPFLHSNYLNRIQFNSGSINCRDCRNYWIQRDSNLVKQIIPWTCSNDNFINCKNGAIK